jgi:hypothetical protein
MFRCLSTVGYIPAIRADSFGFLLSVQLADRNGIAAAFLALMGRSLTRQWIRSYVFVFVTHRGSLSHVICVAYFHSSRVATRASKIGGEPVMGIRGSPFVGRTGRGMLRVFTQQI